MGSKKKKQEVSAIEVNQNENEKAKEPTGLDFYKGYSVNPYNKHPFPYSFLNEPRVLFEKGVYEEILKHSKEDVSIELCGVLIGEVRYDDSGNYLYVVGSIRGEKARNSAVQVSFTHETWDYINNEKEKKFSSYSIIGWYHTHPGFGIFLSDMDKFIQDFFFNQPYSVALVVDPKNDTSGIFAWIDGKIRPISYFWDEAKKTSLIKGRVGGEETFINEESDNIIPLKRPNELAINSNPNATSVEKELRFGFSYIIVSFILGFMLCQLMLSNYITNAVMTASREETRGLLFSWVQDYSISQDLLILSNELKQRINNIESLSATATVNIDSYKDDLSNYNQYVELLISQSNIRKQNATNVLKEIGNRQLNNNANYGKILEAMKKAVGHSLMLQISNYLNSLTAQPLNIERIKEARKLVDHIITLCPELEQSVRASYPWIFDIQ